MKILIVDDKKENLYLLERVITKIGYEAVIAENGEQALEKLYNDNFLMVISDILMPVMDGFQLCKIMRSIKKFNNILFIFYTATYLEREDEEFALELGADKFLRKPLEPGMLIEEIKKLIQKNEINQGKHKKTIIIKEKEILKLYSERLIHKLEKKMVDLEKETTERKEAINNLKERVKELTFLFKMSKLIESSDITMEGIFQGLIDLIPSCWQFPNLTFVKINFNNNEFKTRNFIESKWKLSEETDIHGKSLKIEVFYSEDKPFLKEEKNILHEIGKRLKICLLLKEEVNKLEESERKFKTIFQAIPDLYFLISRDGTIIEYKGDIKELLSSPEVFLGKKIKDFMPKEIVKMTEESIKELFRSKQPQIIEYRLQTPNNEINFFEGRFQYFNEEKVTVFIRNITQRKLFEEELRIKSHAIESSINAIIMTNLNGNLIYVNPAWLKLWGYSSVEEVFGKNMNIFFSHMNIEVAKEKIKKLHETGKWSDELNGNKKDGTNFNVHISASTVFDDNNKPIQMMASFIDITEQKEAQALRRDFNQKLEHQVKIKTKELNEALEQEKLYKDQLLKSSQFKSEFMASMSHELRTPLNSIIGFTDVILERISGEINEEQDKYLNNVKSSALLLLDLINDVLDIAKIEAGKVELHIEDVNLSKIINQIDTMLKPTYEKKNLKFEMQKFDKDKVIRVDRLRFKEILFNLLSNAVKYTKAGGVKLEILENEDDWVINIIDTGIGIAKQDFNIIFKEFKRVKSEDTNWIEGTGLGLPLTKKFIELHGGNISFTSEIGKGSTFTLTIPR